MTEDLTAQIGLVPTSETLFQRVIAWVQGSPYVHTVIAVDNEHCIGAESPSPQIRPIDHFPGIVFSHYDLTQEQKLGIVLWARLHAKTHYNWAAILLIGVERLTRRHAPNWVVRIISSSKRLMCSQMVDAAYLYGAGMQLFADRRYFGIVSPSDYVPLFMGEGWL